MTKDVKSVKFYYEKIIDGMLKKEKELLLENIEMQKRISRIIEIRSEEMVKTNIDLFYIKNELETIKNRRIYKLLKFLKVWQ